ncbi:MAG: tetratricopeptide repeat protein [Acidobacteria bacterium]|nr:tetratricopeptide repeat protein [Acidobacteriota bacterium]
MEQVLTGGEKHSYLVTLAAGQYLHVVIDQGNVDLSVTLWEPNNKLHAKFDSRWYGPEPVSLIAPTSGVYRLEVSVVEKMALAVRYQIRIEERRGSIPQDQHWMAAERVSTEAKQLHTTATAATLQRAIAKYQEAFIHWRTTGDTFGESQTLNSLGTIYERLNQNEKALEYYEKALTLRRAARDLYGEAETTHNIAAVYSARDTKQKAIDYYTQAITLRRSVGDKRGEAATILNLGKVHYDLGENQKAFQHMDQALALMRAVGYRRGEAVALLNLASYCQSSSDIQAAQKYFSQALPLMRALEDRFGEASTLNNLGKTYHDLDEKERAIDYFNEALQLFRSAGNRGGEASVLNNMGAAFQALGERQRAIDHYTRSIELYRDADNRRGEARALNNIGRVYSEIGDQQKALDCYHQALARLRAIVDRRGEAITLRNMGAVYALLRENPRALDYYGQALQLSRAVEDRTIEVPTLYAIAHLERERGQIGEARSCIESGLNVIESLRAKIVSPELRASYFATVRQYYEFYTDLLMRLHARHPGEGYLAAAFQTSERARARTLIEMLGEARVDIRQGVDPALLERERRLQALLNVQVERQTLMLSGKPSEEQAQTVKKKLVALVEEYKEAQAQIRASSPRYAALTQPQPLSLSEIQQHVLDSDTLILEYALGDERSFLWVVAPTSITGFDLSKRSVVEAAVRRVYERLTARNRPVKGETTQQGRARAAAADARSI